MARETDLQKLIGSLPLPAKTGLLTGAGPFTLRAEPSIGLAELAMSDGPMGVRGLKFADGRVSVLLPNATLLASTWNPDAIYQVGRLLAEEALAQNIHVVLGPVINLHRSPLGGRLFEAFSEDPLLSGALAAAYVRGLQDQGVAACPKHLVGNESETERNTADMVIDEATLREVYLLPFEIAVTDGGAWSLMAAYNHLNGVLATEHHHVINDIVKTEWGFDGLVVSDWHAARSVAETANGGLDLVMPGPGGPWDEGLERAVTDGEVTEATVDDHLLRLLRLADRVGCLAQPPRGPATFSAGLPAPVAFPTPESAERRDQLTRLAASGMVVLKNDGPVLPLSGDLRVAVIGRHAIETIGMGGGSVRVNPPYQVSVADGLAAALGDRITVVDGVEVRTRPALASPEVVLDPVTGEHGVHALLYAADGRLLDERHLTSALLVTGFDDELPEPAVTVVLRAHIDVGPAHPDIEIGGVGAGNWTVRSGDRIHRFELRTSGNDFGEAMLAPPSYARPMTLDRAALVEFTATKAPAVGADEVSGVGYFGLIAGPVPRSSEAVIAAAVDAAVSCDVAVVVVGLTEEQETEAADKTTLRLPGEQDDMVAAVAAVAPRTVVVLNTATPVLMPWLNSVEAVLYAGLPGQEAGHAVAAALLGVIEPAGRLATTFPRHDTETPAWSVTPVAGVLEYAEGSFVGYRGHAAGRAAEPAFWFGHGLGYSTWEYGPVRWDAGNPAPTLTVPITNTGDRPSREVVQVYFEPRIASEPTRLVGWVGIDVDGGAVSQATVRTDPRLYRRWDVETGSWVSLGLSGRYLVARGLGDVRAELRLDLPPVAGSPRKRPMSFIGRKQH